MPTNIFVNLAVKDLEKSKAFFMALGYTFNPQFTDQNAACLVISPTIYAMLIVPAFFQTFTSKEIIDATKQVETLLALTCEDRAQVDDLAARAEAAGGKVYRTDDQGWMYTKSIEDLDGHNWEFFYMDVTKAPKA